MTSRNIPASSLSGSLRGQLGALLLGTGLLLLPLSLPADDNLKSLFNFQTKMAAQGNTEAMIRLGEMCEEGMGVEKSEQNAREWYQKARDKGNPEGQTHLDQMEKKRERTAREKAAREQAAAREQEERQKAAREEAAREQAAREQAARAQEERQKAAEREEAEKREAAKKAMTPEEKERARAEAIRRAQEAEKASLQKQLDKEQAESDALKRARSAASAKKK